MLTVDKDQVVCSLQRVCEKLDQADHDVIVDLSSVRRIDSAAIREMERLAVIAEGKSMKVTLSSVNVDIYKVLKLVRLTPRFSFLH